MAAAHGGPPIAGAYISPIVTLANVNTNTTVFGRFSLPAGMTAVLIGASAQASGIASDPLVSVGNTTDTDGYCVTVSLTTAVQQLAIAGALSASGRASIPNGGVVQVTVVNDGGDTMKCANVMLHMYVTAHATNIPAD